MGKTIQPFRALPHGMFVLVMPVIRTSMTGLAVLSLLVLVAGPSMSLAFIESSPAHSHIYLSTNAPHNHTVAISDHEGSSEVISVIDRSGTSLSGPIDTAGFEAWSHVVSLSVFVHRPAVDSNYANPDIDPPEQPPRYS